MKVPCRVSWGGRVRAGVLVYRVDNQQASCVNVYNISRSNYIDPLQYKICIQSVRNIALNESRTDGAWKAYLVEVYEDLIGCEVRKVTIRISSEEPLLVIDKVVGTIDLFDSDDLAYPASRKSVV